jgi:hypothetical protein
MAGWGDRLPRGRFALAVVSAAVTLGLAMSAFAIGIAVTWTREARAAELTGSTQPAGAAPPGGAVPGAGVAPARTAEGPCGRAAGTTAAQTVARVAERIYANEAHSDGVPADRAQIENYGPLLSALARGDRAAVTEAVSYLVYSHTHIVRLRLSRGGEVLADVGGPYILAPQRGHLHYEGRTVGSYVFSVQDDAGYAKLATRFVEVPVLLRERGVRLPVEATMDPGSQRIPANGPVRYHGISYEALSFNGEAFLGERLQITLLVRVPRSTLSCEAIGLLELRRVGEITWGKFSGLSTPWSAYTGYLRALTGSLVYVRAGSHQIAGTNPGPQVLPTQGTVLYGRLTYLVTSFPVRFAGQGIRIYQLVSA